MDNVVKFVELIMGLCLSHLKQLLLRIMLLEYLLNIQKKTFR